MTVAAKTATLLVLLALSGCAAQNRPLQLLSGSGPVYPPEARRAGIEGEVTVRFVGELTSVVKNAEGEVVEGNANEIKRQRDVWTFARKMGADNPNWQLVATGE